MLIKGATGERQGPIYPTQSILWLLMTCSNARNQCINNNGWFSNSGIVWFQQQILVLLAVSATDEFTTINSSPPGQNGRHFADFKCIFMNEKFFILIRISLKFVPKGPIDCKSALVQEMAWQQIGDKPLSELKLHWRIYAALRGD